MAGIDGVFKALDISGSALTAQRYNMEIISQNLAYSDVDSLNGGRPYHRREVTFEALLDRAGSLADPHTGVRAKVRIDRSRGQLVDAPDDLPPGTVGVRNGMIEKSNVEPSQEMVRLIEASRAYEANVAAVKAFREMVNRALSIGR
jgi:flagellar basal-body rod protein FlgC